MATSGTATFNPSVQQIVDGALRKVGAIAEGETSASTTLYTDSALALNALIKAWMASGLHVWTEQEGILFPQPGQAKYLIGTGSTDNTCDASSYVQTTLASAAAQGATTVTLASAAGLSSGQKIGIQLSTGATFWTTVSGAPSGVVVTLAAGLTASAAAGAFATAYTAALVRPLLITNARLLNFASGNETPLRRLSRQEYMDLTNKLSKGSPSQFFYSPQLNAGELYLWQAPLLATSGIRFTWLRPIYDITDPTQTVDFPQEWVLPLTWALAEEMAPEFDVPPPRWQMIRQKSAEAKDLAACWDRESEDVQFGISHDGW